MSLSSSLILFSGIKGDAPLINGPLISFSSYVYVNQQNYYQHALTQFAPWRSWVSDQAWNPDAPEVEQLPALRTGQRTGSGSGIMFMVGDTYTNRPILALDPVPEYRMDSTQGDKGYEVKLRYGRMFYYNTPGMVGEQPGWELEPPDTVIYEYYLMRVFDIAGNNHIAVRASQRVDSKVSLFVEVTQGSQVVVSDPILMNLPLYSLYTVIMRYTGTEFSIAVPEQNLETKITGLVPYDDPEANIEFFDSDATAYAPGHVNVGFLEIQKLVAP